MTRDEAVGKVKKVVGHFDWCVNFVEALSVLGLLKLETPDDADQLAAVNYLRLHGYSSSANMIVADLLHGGFKITKEPVKPDPSTIAQEIQHDEG